MRLSTVFAGAVIACTATFGLAVPAFASTTNPAPPVAPTFQPTGQPDHHDGGGDWGKGGGNNQGGNDWGNNGGDGKGCHQNDGRGNDWNSNDRNRNCDPQGDGNCRTVRTLLPSHQCDNNCRDIQLTSWTGHQDGPWQFGDNNNCDNNHGHGGNGQGDDNHGRNHDNHGRHHHRVCTPELVTFNFPHGTAVITETQGPWLSVNEVATYQGQTFTIASVTHTGFLGHDLFTVDNSSGHLVVNHGPSIWHGEAHVVTCR